MPQSLEAALQECTPRVARILASVLEGKELGFAEGLALAEADGPGLRALVRVADECRRRAVGETITYVVNRNINFTNVCFVGCAFCGFGQGPNHPSAYYLSLEEIVAKAREAVSLGATEVCIQGGLPKDLDGFWYRDILRAIKTELPSMHIHAFSPMEIDYGVTKTGLGLRDYLEMLREAGLGSIPGTAAEILDDEIRQRLSPNKLPVARWVEVIKTAHQVGIPTTSTMMYGHVEHPSHWVRHILLLRDIQKETGGITEFVPLGFIHPNTRLYQLGNSRPGRNFREDLLVHALARLLLGQHIPNIQVSWVKLGLETSLECLRAGANDFGGTLMEESISKAAGSTHGDSITAEELRAAILSIHREAAERTTTYKILQRFPVEVCEGAPVGVSPVVASVDAVAGQRV